MQAFNRPGLTAVAYRAGTHSLFKRTLLARLSSADHPELRDLTTRDGEDFTIALLDAWSTVADVLTFYQERIANEAYLRTATERLSVLEMARLIGYRLDPGVAASVLLAFEIESAKAPLARRWPPATPCRRRSSPAANDRPSSRASRCKAFQVPARIPRRLRPSRKSRREPNGTR